MPKLDSAPLNGDGATHDQLAPMSRTLNAGVLDGATTDTQTYRNRILSALPSDVLERLAPHMRRILLHQGDTLQEAGAMIERVYFVEKGLTSLLVEARDGFEVEASVIGAEGMVGATCVLNDQPAFHRTVVQIPGSAYMLPISVLCEELARHGALENTLHTYLRLMLSQVSQSVLCNRIHTVEERLSRWLLIVRDSVGSDEFDLTHEFIARMLGVRRSGVTIAMGILQQSGLIESTRGHVSILDGEKIESSACECYGAIHKQYQEFKRRTQPAPR